MKRPSRLSRADLNVSFWTYSQDGINNTIRSNTTLMTTWVTLMRMNSSWSRDAKPQQWPPSMVLSQKAATGTQENQLQRAKVTPDTTVMTSMHLQSMRTRRPVKTRWYWRSSATLMKVLDKG